MKTMAQIAKIDREITKQCLRGYRLISNDEKIKRKCEKIGDSVRICDRIDNVRTSVARGRNMQSKRSWL